MSIVRVSTAYVLTVQKIAWNYRNIGQMKLLLFNLLGVWFNEDKSSNYEIMELLGGGNNGNVCKRC